MESFLCALLGAKGHTCLKMLKQHMLYSCIMLLNSSVRPSGLILNTADQVLAFRYPDVAVKCIGVQGLQIGIPQ